MRLIDVVTSPWALQPEKLLEIRAVYETHLRGEKIDLKAVEARLGQPLANAEKPYTVYDGGVAVVSLVGVLAKRANLFTDISGGTSTRKVANQLAAAANDPAVTSIILEIDSPGGQVDGVMELAGMVKSVRESKPVAAWVSGVAASGGYWIASAAERVLIADETTLTGSIGVVATHVDVSRREEALGIKTTEITAGKYKRVASSYQPLSEEGRATLQQQVDALYSVFVEAVAAQRGASVDDVLNRMADGRVFIGRQGIEAGLVDGVSTLTALIDEMRSSAGARVSSTTSAKGRSAMNRDQLKADHPAVFDAVHQEGHAAGVTEGARGERARVTEILATAKAAGPAHAELASKAVADGMTAGQFAQAVLQAEADARAQARAAIAAAAPKPLAETPPPADKPSATDRQQLHEAAETYATQHKVSYVDAVRVIEKQQRQAA